MECWQCLVPGALKGGAPKQKQLPLKFGSAPAVAPAVQTATPTLDALQSCGAPVLEACLQEPPCQRHSLFAEVAAMVALQQGMQTPPSAARAFESPPASAARAFESPPAGAALVPVVQGMQTPPSAAPAFQSPLEGSPVSISSLQHSTSMESLASECSSHEKGSKEWCAVKGKLGAEKRRSWLDTRKSAGAGKQVYEKKLTLQKEHECVKYCLENKPTFTIKQS